jgi:hypothetical protein
MKRSYRIKYKFTLHAYEHIMTEHFYISGDVF